MDTLNNFYKGINVWRDRGALVTQSPIFSDSLNLTPPAPLYLQTLWRYTNAVIIIIISMRRV